MTKIRTRFAPSPTGTPESIHLGFVIRALWNYAFAKKNKGDFILRIEDTDQKRSSKETEQAIMDVLKKFWITWDEGPDVGGPHGPYRQSERLTKYQEAAKKLVEKGYAYYDFDADKREKEEIKNAYSSKDKLLALKQRPAARENELAESLKRIEQGEKYVVRIKMPEDRIFEYEDWILKKKIKVLGKEVQDLIILKSDGFPTYHLAVVVDDIDMQISHVFRGQEWISSTPIHLYIYEGLDHPVPEIGHFSVILDPRTGKKFSKRDVTSMFGVDTWLKKGFLKEAILNYLMLLGWAPKDNREIFTLEEFVNEFNLEGLQKANPTFDANKLEWMNSEYIKSMSDNDLMNRIYTFYEEKYPQEVLQKIVPLAKERMRTLADFKNLAGFIFEEVAVDASLLGDDSSNHLTNAIEALEEVNEWNLNNINNALMNMIKENDFHVGKFFMDFRVAIAGSKVTPPINESIEILGKEKTLERLRKVI